MSCCREDHGYQEQDRKEDPVRDKTDMEVLFDKYQDLNKLAAQLHKKNEELEERIKGAENEIRFGATLLSAMVKLINKL
jgi:uncharacterized protein YlxW (UPF0749 family)